MPFLPFVYGYPSSSPRTKACLFCATPAGMDLYIQVHAQRLPQGSRRDHFQEILREVELDLQVSPEEIMSREAELG